MGEIEYIRVSSESQDLDRQLYQINEIGIDLIFQEKISDATTNRKELQNMLNELKEGDTIYITDLTRITRSIQDILNFFYN
ncbi:DNA invertase Pin-like site-specific DNA recombinase [Fusobacterium sp. PH5-7]|uniref:recombinase family protein n=1 Tax=Fusobacterium sp. PH5-7 TaxID=2940528 RepID=UPI00247728D7|nr:recombinase family protein [Fusobacterium sp. PH5-7]MDH6458230.1 DNA invertase Pin-like site-specific DNA recombinase [Fusobacterium sp. PH5-7]